jgi:lipopolysaccharide/colanic/teichoic acid biosynthesis glycosyltransferase
MVAQPGAGPEERHRPPIVDKGVTTAHGRAVLMTAMPHEAPIMSDRPQLSSPFVNRLRARYSLWAWRCKTRSLHVLKRGLDIAVVLPALLVLSPLFAAVAIAIKLHDGGSVLFWQRRVGRDGREFAFPKFRSMCVDAESVRTKIEAANQHGADGVTFKMKRDPRITPVGRMIRRTSIDELPQLWCVLKGEMSLVGPRPPIPKEVARYSLADRARLSVTPGLTCIWQVSGRSEIPFPEQVRMDVRYIHEQSLAKDVKLLIATVPAVIRGKGAY